MPAESALIESIALKVLERLDDLQAMERILILRERKAGPEISLPEENGVARRYYYRDEARPDITYDRWILPRLEISDLVDLAQGKPGSDKVAGVLHILLAGNTVEVIEFAHLAYEQTAPASLFELYRGYTEKVAGFGLVSLAKVQREAACDGRILGERAVEQFHAEGVSRIRLAADSLVTPLAEECARKFGIEIQRDQRGA